MSCDLPYWLEVTKALGPPIIAAVAALIAFGLGRNQLKVARDKVRLDLFDRRLELYRAANSIIELVNTDGLDAEISLQDLISTLRPAEWLVGERNAEFLDEEIAFKAKRYFLLKRRLQTTPTDAPAWQKIADEYGEIGVEIVNQKDKLKSMFAKFISFKDIRG